jgi:uncharacterized BrkB/YihY/UPF0761 family membrane protein
MATIPEDHVEREYHASTDKSERSLASLLKELRDETTMLMREELELAKTEISEKVNRLSRNVAYLATGGLVAFAGLIVLLLAASAGLRTGLIAMDLISPLTADWLAPLIVAAVVIVIGYVLLQKAINTLKEETVVPERTVKTVQDDKNWIKEKVSR